MDTPSSTTSRTLPAILTVVALVMVGAWSFWPTLVAVVLHWKSDPNYSQGYLIPFLALGIFAFRLRTFGLPELRPALLLGGLGFLIAVACRFASSYFYFTPLDHFALLLSLVSGLVLVGGVSWLRVALPAIFVLVFCFPIPAALGGADLVGGLQTFATRASTFALQVFGVVSFREGNTILLKSGQLGVVEACSGLRMLMVFCALATVTASLIPGGWIRKSLLVLSAIPLAIFCNVLRITVAGIASESMGTETGHFIFHDLAGWLMMPLAFVLFGIEVLVFNKLVVIVPETRRQS